MTGPSKSDYATDFTKKFSGGSPFVDNEAAPFKEGQAATHELGVLYQAPWERLADGFNEHARRNARALALTGCPVQLRGVGGKNFGVERSLMDQMGPLLDASIGRYSVQVQQLIITEALAQAMGRHRFLSEEEFAVINHYRVLYSVWERDRVSPIIATFLNRMGQVWVACYRNVAMLVRSGVDHDKIRVVPVPYFDDDPLLKLRGRTRRRGVPRFYHIGKWEPRKAQDKILEAFMTAFRPGEATLTVKTSPWNTAGEGYPASPDAILATLLPMNGWTEDNYKNSIEIIVKRLTDAELVALHGFGDIYVTLSRGEGFDMPAFDAKLAGNRMVYTPSGGPVDFAGPNDLLVPETGAIACHSFYGWEKESTYLDFDLDHAATAMQLAAREIRNRAHPNAFNVSEPLVPSWYQAKIVGENMLRNLTEVVGESGKVF